MADVIDYKIYGDDMQAIEIELDPGEGVRAEAGAMLYMENGIEMQTNTGGGMFKGFKRMLTGDSFFITTFLYNGAGKGHVAFGAPYPGKIIPLDLAQLGLPDSRARVGATPARHEVLAHDPIQVRGVLIPVCRRVTATGHVCPDRDRYDRPKRLQIADNGGPVVG